MASADPAGDAGVGSRNIGHCVGQAAALAQQRVRRELDAGSAFGTSCFRHRVCLTRNMTIWIALLQHGALIQDAAAVTFASCRSRVQSRLFDQVAIGIWQPDAGGFSTWRQTGSDSSRFNKQEVIA
jgi:hypothetical protein